MDRKQFEQKLKHASKEINKDEIASVIKKSLSAKQKGMFEGYKNLIVVMEEFSECSKEVSKVLRGQGDKIGLLEETADALMNIYYIQEICGISDEDLAKAVNVKLERQKKRNREKK